MDPAGSEKMQQTPLALIGQRYGAVPIQGPELSPPP